MHSTPFTRHSLIPCVLSALWIRALWIRALWTMGLWIAVLWVAVPSTMAQAPPDPDGPGVEGEARLRALIERMDWERTAHASLGAQFTRMDSGGLLLEPEESSGTVIFTRSGQVRWDFETPEPKVVWMEASGSGGSRMTTWSHGSGHAERVDLGTPGERILALFGGGSLAHLERHFEFRATFPADPTAPYRLDLQPRTLRMLRRISAVTLQIDRTRFAPQLIRVESANEAVTEIHFAHWQVDVPLETRSGEPLMEPNLPPGVELVESTLPGLASQRTPNGGGR